MSKTFRTIVVGAGGISKAWFGPLKEEGVHVAAVVDLNRDAAQQKIDEYQLDGFASDDLDKTLAEVDADFLIDLTIPEAHCNVCCKAMEAGLHVVSEKPMAASMDEARKMVATSEKTGKLYMVSQSRRWEPKHDSYRRSLTNGQLGQLTTINCDFYLAPHFGGFRDEMQSPLILDMAIHHFDLARFFTNTDPVAVYAHEFNPYGSWYKGDAATTCIFEMSDGIVFTYRGSWCAQGCGTSWNGHWRIIGEKGTMLYEKDATPIGQVVNNTEGFFNEYKDAHVEPSPIEHKTMRGALREMLTFLREGKTPQTQCLDNIKSLAMVFAAMQSSREGKRIVIEI
jgi:predicted dehydrogenase